MRIVSLLPSATEIVCALGLESDLVGVTHECDYPEFVKTLPKVTRTIIPHDAASGEIDALVRERLRTTPALYTLDMPTLEILNPDLLVTQALCDVCAVAEEEVQAAACSLRSSPRVLNLEPASLADVLDTLWMVGEATGREERAREVIAALRRRIEAVGMRTAAISMELRPRVVFLEWIDPLFNGGHWNPALIELAGGVDALHPVRKSAQTDLRSNVGAMPCASTPTSELSMRRGKSGSPPRAMPWEDLLRASGPPSRTTAWEALAASQPDALFIACCGFSADRALQDLPILKRPPGWSDLPCVRSGRIYVSDGNAYFSRPGPRLVDGLEIMAQALHPDIHPLPARLPAARRITSVSV